MFALDSLSDMPTLLKKRCWARQTCGLIQHILPYIPPLIRFFQIGFVSVLFIFALSLLSDGDRWFRSADCWNRDSDILYPGNYNSPWNCILDSHLAGDPAGHFTAQLPLSALLLVMLLSLLLSLLLLLFEHLETPAVVPRLKSGRCCRLRRYLHIVEFVICDSFLANHIHYFSFSTQSLPL